MEIKYLRHPVIPDIYFRPDFLIRKNGKLFSLNLTQWSVPHTTSIKTLELIEELFEIKISLGNSTISSLLIIGSPNIWGKPTLSILNTFYDYICFIKKFSHEDISERILEILSKEPKDELFKLWDFERRHREEVGFEYPLDYLKEFKYNPEYITTKPRDNPILHVLKKKLNLKKIEFKSAIRLPCLITELIPGARFHQYFDLFSKNCLIKTVNIRPESGYHKIKQLLIRGRLVRYQTKKGKIVPIEDVPELILLSNGFPLGPSHDPDRFLLMLTDTGWRVFPTRKPGEKWEVVDYLSKKR